MLDKKKWKTASGEDRFISKSVPLMYFNSLLTNIETLKRLRDFDYRLLECLILDLKKLYLVATLGIGSRF